MFRLYLEECEKSKVLAHISGASGSGKTTLINNLSKKYKNINFKDLDDFDDLAVKQLGWDNVKKNDYTDKMLRTLANRRQKLIDDFIRKSNKPIVFAGIHVEGDNVQRIPTENRFLLNVNAKTSAWRAYKRSQTEDPKYRRKKSELPLDIKDAQEIIDWLLKNGYKPMSVSQIEKEIANFSMCLKK